MPVSYGGMVRPQSSRGITSLCRIGSLSDSTFKALPLPFRNISNKKEETELFNNRPILTSCIWELLNTGFDASVLLNSISMGDLENMEREGLAIHRAGTSYDITARVSEPPQNIEQEEEQGPTQTTVNGHRPKYTVIIHQNRLNKN